MASYVLCPSCQTSSPETATFCYKCGASLVGAAPGNPPLTPAPPPDAGPVSSEFPYPPLVPLVSYDTTREIDRTKTGVILLAIGALLSWMPVVGILGSLLVLVGAILVILGRDAFGAKHARNVGVAIVLFFIGVLGSLALLGLASSGVVTSGMPPDQAEAAVTAAFSNLLISGILLVVISDLSPVLFIWELLNGTGRAVILLAYLAAIGIAVLVYATIMPQLPAALVAAYSASPPNLGPIASLDSEVNGLHLLQVIPALLDALAAYIAWSRIDTGEIP